MAGTPVKSNTHAVHHHVHGFPLAHVTAVSLAAAVTGTSAHGENSDIHANSDAQGTTGVSVNAAAKRRMSRLKQSKWDSDSMDVENDTAPAHKTTSNLTSSIATSVPTTSATTAASMQPSKQTTIAVEEEEEEVDPLEAFMTSLYGTGDVAVQKNLPSEVIISLLCCSWYFCIVGA